MEENRTCGTCVACCVYPSINEGGVKKSAFKPCRNLIDSEELLAPRCEEEGAFQGMLMLTSKHLRGIDTENCMIYEGRPESCKSYRCAWLDGHGEKEDRPDKSGVVIDDINHIDKIRNSLIAKPLWWEAEEQYKGVNAIANISRSSNLPIIVLQFTEFKIMRIVGRGVE